MVAVHGDRRRGLAIANEQLKLMGKFMAEIGLPPASRSRASTLLRLGPRPWEVSWFAGLIGRPNPANRFFND